MEKHSTSRKDMVYKHLAALQRFNEWEKHRLDKMDGLHNLYAVFDLYDLIPEDARQREINIKGIMKMRKALECLK